METKTAERILVADDDATSRKLLVRILAKAGFSCTEASDGVETLAALRASPSSLLLLDFDMPQMDGAQVLKQLRQDSDTAMSQIPTIMLTGHGGEASEVLCLEAGADDFVTKPINQPVLRARIDTQLRLRSMRRQLQQQNDELEAWRENLERDLAAARLTQHRFASASPLITVTMCSRSRVGFRPYRASTFRGRGRKPTSSCTTPISWATRPSGSRNSECLSPATC